jgi:Cu/Zn superoxide dismutase
MSRIVVRCALPALALAIGVVWQAPATAQSPVSPAGQSAAFRADLKDAKGKSHGTVTATLDKGLLSWTARYSGLSEKPSAAHFHGPAEPGQNAEIQVNATNLANPMTGTWALSEGQVIDLMANRWYFNIHTKKNPGGEARGQLVRAR